MILKTKRLILRPWSKNDLVPYAAINGDPQTMQFYPSTLSKEQSDEQGLAMGKLVEENGWGFWALEIPNEAKFIGFCGLHRVTFDAHFTPCVELGYRIAKKYWRQGYAHEASQAALKYAFETLKLDEVVAFTSTLNLPSISLMKKLGMTRNAKDDFNHPRVSKGLALEKHVLYRLNKLVWQVANSVT